jgi:hypothetical protein
MYTMMTKKDYPGYGFMLENGATTAWEHWRGERSGSIIVTMLPDHGITSRLGAFSP